MRAWCEVSLSRYTDFFITHKTQLSRSVRVLAVVKANAYGLGAVTLALALQKKQCADYLAVATPLEGKELREAGIDLPILLLSEPPHDQLNLIVTYNLTPVAYTHSYILALEEIARIKNHLIKIHLKIDTGMNRLGCKPKSAKPLF